jgi:hypothetical protein
MQTFRTIWWSEASLPALASKARGFARARLRRSGAGDEVTNSLQPGLPTGCTPEMVDQACREILRKPLSDTRFRHLSSWKPHGAYLVEATATDGEVTTLVFKRTVATPEFNPILHRLPFTPGPAEYVILGRSSTALSKFLPRVFHHTELQPGVEFLLVVEDLDTSHRRLGRNDVINLIGHLGEFHAALADHVARHPSDHLIDYLAIRDELPEFFRYRLREHYVERGDRLVGRLLKQFDGIAEAYRSVELPEKAIGTVHGDPNLSNIRMPRHGEARPKFIDWEWAGSHLLHIDLAAILKFADPVLERDSVSRFATLHPDLPVETHRRLYYWCKLDRSLLDVCLMATLAENPTPRRMDVDLFLRRSARAALHGHTQLKRYWEK